MPPEPAADAPARTPEAMVPATPAAVSKISPLAAPLPWTLRELGYFFAFAAAWLVVSNLLTVIGYAALKPHLRWSTPVPELQENAFFGLVAQMVFYGPVFGYIYHLVVARYSLRFWTAFPWGKLGPHHWVRFSLGGVLLALLAARAPQILPDRESFPLQQFFSSPQAAYAVAAFAVLVAPFMEELIFRGVFFTVFEHRAGAAFAVVLSTAVFAGFHVPEYWGAWNHLLLVSLAGAAFSVARGLTRSLGPSIILHTTYNASIMTGLFFETQHFRTLHAFIVR